VRNAATSEPLRGKFLTVVNDEVMPIGGMELPVR